MPSAVMAYLSSRVTGQVCLGAPDAPWSPCPGLGLRAVLPRVSLWPHMASLLSQQRPRLRVSLQTEAIGFP